MTLESALAPANDDDVLVLPWWQNPRNIVTIVVTVALLAGMSGWLMGRTSSEQNVASSAVDVGFLHDMRVHHEQAVDMSRIYLERPDTSSGLRLVADSILFGQSIEIGLMIQLLRDMDAPTEGEVGQSMAWMGMAMADTDMPGMATVDQLEALAASSGDEADRLYIELMTAHHHGALEMTEQAVARAENPDVGAYAAAWNQSQTEEIAELQGLLPDPAG